MMLDTRSNIYPQIPADHQTKDQTNPTLLVSWWATIFSLVIIIARLCGRYIRIERLFPEDKVMMASVIPLMARMALVHVILIWGTNNTKTDGMLEDETGRREIGSKLVLAARIFYAMFIWTAKFTVCEFLKRVAGMIWSRSLQMFLRFLYYFLASTLVAVVIATLAECQPFHHYWQVVPDPDPRCRSGYAHLITMGTCDVVTDLLLVAYPIPVIWRSLLPVKRKASLVALFALSLILVGITCFRVPSVISRHGSQQYRSLLASLEILAATVVSNVVVISSFVRDKGIKKPKFERAQGCAFVNESMDCNSSRRATITRNQWGSDSDLAGDLGIRLDPEICSSSVGRAVSLPEGPIATVHRSGTACTGTLDPNWSFDRQYSSSRVGLDDDSIAGSYDISISPKASRKNSDAPLLIPPSFSPHKVCIDGPTDPSPLPTTTSAMEHNTQHSITRDC